MTGDLFEGGACHRSPGAHDCNGLNAPVTYPANPTAGKAIAFRVDGKVVKFRSKRAAMLRALMAAKAAGRGVCHAEILPWGLNANDIARSLRGGGVAIVSKPGQPPRWFLTSDVVELDGDHE